ncbi:MAG: Ig-like domain-containing protein [Velocimicrobium sp.]
MKMKKFAKVIILSLALSMTAQTVAPVSIATHAEAAAKIKLNVSKKTIMVGKSFTLKVKGTSKKVTFRTNKKAVASVTKSGKVKGKSAGKATITVKVDGKKYACKVTVKEKENKFVTNAPFEAAVATVGDNTVVMPKDWK